MKTTIEVHGYEIKIDEMNDKIMVSAVKEGETVEEFELEVEAGFEDDDMGMQSFGDEGDEEEDFDSDEMGGDDDMEEMEDEMEEEEDEKKLESFANFVRRKK